MRSAIETAQSEAVRRAALLATTTTGRFETEDGFRFSFS